MDFIKLNGRKVISVFFLWLVISGVISLFGYLSFRKGVQADIAMLTERWTAIMYGFGVFIFLMSFLLGIYKFYKTRKLLRIVLSLGIFDGNEYTSAYLNERYWVIYTTECMYGTINGYPVIVTINHATGKGEVTKIEFIVCILKFKHTAKEIISFRLNWSGEPQSDNLKHDIGNFISGLKEKGYPPGDVSQALADQ